MTTPPAGFVTNAAAVASIGTSYAVGKVIKLFGVPENNPAGTTIVDTNARPMPPLVRLSHLEIWVTQGSATTVTCYLTNDAAGDHPITDEATITLIPGLTTATKAGGAGAIDAWFSENDNQTATGEVYLWCKGDNTFTLDEARLYWVQRDDLL